MRIILTLISLLFVYSHSTYSQQEDYQLGLNPRYLGQNQGAYYDYSDPEGLNIKVAVWVYVKYPGRVIII